MGAAPSPPSQRVGRSAILLVALVAGCECSSRGPSEPAGPRVAWTYAPASVDWDVPAAVAASPDGVVLLAWSWTPDEADRGSAPPRMPRTASLSLVKLDLAGDPVWTRTFGGHPGDLAFDLLVTPAGEIVVVGETRGLALDGLAPLAASGRDGFVAWFDREGRPLRVVRVGGSGDERLLGLARRDDGSLLVAGGTSSSDLVPGRAVAGSMDGLLVALAPDGDVLWQRAFGGEGVEIATAAGDGFVGGIASSSALDLDGARADGLGRFDTWVARLDASGSARWLESLGGPGDDYAYDLAADADGILLGGVTQGDDLLARGLWQSYVERVAPDGARTPIWSACCVHYDYAVALAPAGDRLVIASSFDGPSFDVGGVTLRVTAAEDDVTAYAAEIDAGGRARWALALGHESPTRRDFNVHAVRVGGGDVVVAMPSWRDGGYDVRVVRLVPPSR